LKIRLKNPLLFCKIEIAKLTNFSLSPYRFCLVFLRIFSDGVLLGRYNTNETVQSYKALTPLSTQKP